jgi:hypothetical protein
MTQLHLPLDLPSVPFWQAVGLWMAGELDRWP